MTFSRSPPWSGERRTAGRRSPCSCPRRVPRTRMMVRPGGAARLPHCGRPSTRDPALTTRPVQPCSEVQAALSAKRPPLLLTSAASSGVPRPTRSFSRSTHRTHLKAVTLMVTSYLSRRARLQEETRGTGSARVPWVESQVVLPAGATDHTHFPNDPTERGQPGGAPSAWGRSPCGPGRADLDCWPSHLWRSS